ICDRRPGVPRQLARDYHEPLSALRAYAGKRGLEILGPSEPDEFNAYAERVRGSTDRFKLRGDGGGRRSMQHRHPRQRRHGLLEHLESLARSLQASVGGYSRHVPTWPRKSYRESKGDWITERIEYDRDRARRLLRGSGRGRALGHEHINRKRHQVPRACLKLL